MINFSDNLKLPTFFPVSQYRLCMSQDCQLTFEGKVVRNNFLGS